MRGFILGVVALVVAGLLQASPAAAQSRSNEGMGVLHRPEPRPPTDVARGGDDPLKPGETETMRAARMALQEGNTRQAVELLEIAAREGVIEANWKLGRMYADGDGVQQDKVVAYEYLRRVVQDQADGNSPDARFAADAAVTLGQYQLEGIPGVLQPHPQAAAETLRYAAAYLADGEAQYQVARLYLAGTGVAKDPIQAARWLRLAADKGQHNAQALLGSMLVKGGDILRDVARGIFWLTIAKENARPDEHWITAAYDDAVAQASQSDRALALKYLEDWLKQPRR